MASRFGVLITGLPRQAKSPYPTSSDRRMMTLGGAFDAGGDANAPSMELEAVREAIHCRTVRRVILRNDK
jgi:hypothetical protein